MPGAACYGGADPYEDCLSVESGSPGAHGTTEIVGGGVRCTAKPNYHGEDQFTYIVSDGHGGNAMAEVVVTVAPVADAPAPVGRIPDQLFDEATSPRSS